MGDERVKIENVFGRIAIAHGMATAAQVEDAVGSLKKLAELGMREKLGAIMVKKGYLTTENVSQILEIQGQRAQSRIEGYEMISKLGQGAMGSVFKAKQISLDRIVALKILSPRLAKDKSYVKRFLTEARSVAKLNHPNIIQGIDVGECKGHYYFAMEYVDGVTLADILREEGPLEEERALGIMEEIAQALEHAHASGLVHRDVKPDNIMVTGAGDAKLCDLGLAKSERADSSDQSDAGSTGIGRVVGTPHYIAPEQARGEKQIDIRADIYSLGATLFHVLTGRTPYSGENPQVVMTKHLTEPIDDPRDVGDGISEGAALLIFKMMAKRVEDRYQTPEELLRDIRTVLRGKVPAHLIGAFAGSRRSTRAAARLSSPKSADIRRPRVRVSSKRRRRSGVTGLVFALGMVALLGFLAVKLLPSLHRPKPDGSSDARPAVAVEPRPSADLTEVGSDPSDVGEVAKALYEGAIRFADDEKNAQEYPEIFRRLREVITAGSGSPGSADYADKARTALAGYGKRQTDDRNRHILRVRAEGRKLVAKGAFSEAYALWDDFPKNLLPEPREKAAQILDSQRKRVLRAARTRFDKLAKKARERAAAGEFDEAVRLLEEAERIDLKGIASRLPAELRLLEAARARRRAETERGARAVRQPDDWKTTWEDILDLASSGDYEGARIMAQEAARRREFGAHIDDLWAVEFDMGRLVLRQEFAVEGLEAKIGKGRVVVHRDGRGYTGTVIDVRDGRITIAPATGGTRPIVILEQDLTPEDIKRHAPIVFSDADGRYDYAILLIYSGQSRKARPLLERCLSSGEFVAKVRRHLKRIGE